MKKRSSLLIGVIGGTAFDAKFGAEFLKSKRINAISLGISETPHEQTILQLSRKSLTLKVQSKIEYLISKACSGIFIYCNSLSGAIDLNYLRNRFDIPLFTPIDIYHSIASRHSSIGVIAANCQSLSNIERVMLEEKPDLVVVGFASLHIVNDIEMGVAAYKIIEKYNLVSLCQDMLRHGADVIVSGCTHFTYFYEELSRVLKKSNLRISLFDPSEVMYENLKKYIKEQS